jgi:hypothetical protein
MAKKKVSTPEPSHRSREGGRSAFAISGVVLAVLLAMSAPDAHAAGFGEVQVASQLGERLYARVPLVGEGAADVATECVRLIPDSVLQDAPALANARIAIDRKSSPPAVVVTTPAPVGEPAVRFVLEMGCGNRLRREFVLLIDPPDLPSVQTFAAQGTVAPPTARAVPGEEPRWGNGAPAVAPPGQAASSPVTDAPLTQPPAAAAVPPRKVAPKPRPKPVARSQVAAQAKPASAPPPPARPPETPKPSTTDRLVLADSDPVAASQPAAEQAAKDAARDAREEALTRQVEALTKEVARMREDMDKLSTRNRELIKEAESRTGWFAAAGLGIVLAGVGLGLLGRRGAKKPSWRDSLEQDGGDADTSSFAPPPAALPEVREEAPDPKKAPAAPAPSYRIAASDTVTDLDVTKIDVQENTGHGTIMNMTTAAGTTMFPSDMTAGTTLGPAERATALQSLDFSLDDFDTPSTKGRPESPLFSPSKPSTVEQSEAARASLFDEIEKAHKEAQKASKKG